MTPPQAMKPFYESPDPIDVNLYADILVTIFRFNATEAMDNVFPTCLSMERSDAVKVCVVRAMVTLVLEVGVSVRVRNIDFQTCCSYRPVDSPPNRP